MLHLSLKFVYKIIGRHKRALVAIAKDCLASGIGFSIDGYRFITPPKRCICARTIGLRNENASFWGADAQLCGQISLSHDQRVLVLSCLE